MKESLPIGTILNGGSRKYAIKSVLGHGGFGITYLATSTIYVEKIPIEAQFAIKEHYISAMNVRLGTTVSVPNANNTAEIQESIDNFLVEAQRLGQLCLDHSGIVRVNESFPENGTAYYVMEYIKGQSLHDYVKHSSKGKLSETDALRLFRPICETIAYLHENRVTHLDIKPENILIRENGEPVLIDFGLSKHYDKKGTPTSTIKAAGCSAGYSPMEQYAGITTFTSEADIYALGATLLYMLSGKDPIISTEMNERIIRQSIPEGVSVRTTDAIVKAMHKLKEDRTHRVDEFRKGLETENEVADEVENEVADEAEDKVVSEPESSVVSETPNSLIQNANVTQKTQIESRRKSPGLRKYSKPVGIGLVCALLLGVIIHYYYRLHYRIVDIGVFSEGLVVVTRTGAKYGFMDKNGSVVIPCEWDSAGTFSEGLALVKDDNGKWGYIDKTGTVVIPCQWKETNSFFEGVAFVKDDNDKWCYIDKTGKIVMVIPSKWREAKDFSCGLAPVKDENDKWGFISKSGIVAIPRQWNEVRNFKEGLAAVQDGSGNWGFIDKTGKLVSSCQWKEADSFSDGMAIVWDNNYKCGFIDKTGKLVIPYQWKYAYPFSNGLALIKDDNGKCGYIDKSGRLVIPCQWEWAWDFSDGLAPVQDDNQQWGFIDKTGKVVIPCQWLTAGIFSEGLASVQDKNGNCHIINKQGEIIK